MSIKNLSSNKSFAGWHKQYSHYAETLNCAMRFAIFLPPQAANGQKVPVLYWLSGLTCTDENFMQKAGAHRVAAELGIVISRFVFSYEQALMGDLVRYWYAALFLFASAYTLLHEGHVRVDVLYAGFGSRAKGRVNSVGSVLLGLVTAWTIIILGLGSKQAIINSPVANFEVSQVGTAGMFVKYQMAAFLAIFAVTMLIQFVSYLFEAVADARDEPGKREITPIAH